MVVRMICPQCGHRNEVGVAQCAACRRPFTRAAAERRAWHAGVQRAQPAAAAPAATAASMPDPFGTTTRRRGSGGRAVWLLIGLVLAGALVWLLLTQVVQPQLGELAVSGIRDGVRAAVQEQVATEVGGLPAGEVTITEQEINERVNARGNLGPIDDLQVHITPEGLLVDLSAYGFDGTYRAAIVERDGSVVLDGGSLDGPLAYAVSDGDLEQAINRELAVALSAAGYRVAGVTLGDGALTLALTAGS